MSNRHSIVQDVLVHEVVLKGRMLLDQFSEGLKSLSVLRLLRGFPDVFQPLFVPQELTAQSVVEILKRVPPFRRHNIEEEDADKTFGMLVKFLRASKVCTDNVMVLVSNYCML